MKNRRSLCVFLKHSKGRNQALLKGNKCFIVHIMPDCSFNPFLHFPIMSLALGWPAIVLSAFFYLGWPFFLNIVLTVQTAEQSGVSPITLAPSLHSPPPPPSNKHTHTQPETPALYEDRGLAQFILSHLIERGVAIILTSLRVTRILFSDGINSSVVLSEHVSECVSYFALPVC